MVVAHCNFCPKKPQKASKRGLLAKIVVAYLNFWSSGGLIKSGLLYARIQYVGFLGWKLVLIFPEIPISARHVVHLHFFHQFCALQLKFEYGQNFGKGKDINGLTDELVMQF